MKHLFIQPFVTIIGVVISLLLIGSSFCFSQERFDTGVGQYPVNVQFRGSCQNSKIIFETTQKGRVAFLGGSITEMEGYRPMIGEFLKQEFPQTEFALIAAGIASTCSTTGAFRLERDVLSQGPIDLLFLEFAVNDDQDANHSIIDSLRGMEGIIRHLWQTNPNTDVIVTFFVNEPMMNAYRQGNAAKSIQAHRMVATHYHLPTVDLAREVTEQIDSGKLTWKEFGGVHPAPRGNRIVADMIEQTLRTNWKSVDSTTATLHPHRLGDPFDPQNYERGRLVKFDHVDQGVGWQVLVPDWKNIPGDCRTRFQQEEMLCSTAAGSEASLDFEGTAIGAYVLAGPDAGMIEYQIDNGPVQTLDLYHSFSGGLHYPRTVLFNADLVPGKHHLSLKVSSQKNPKSNGTAVRILALAVNGP